MMQLSQGKYRSASLAALLALLPLTGYIWSQPISMPMLVISGILMALSFAAVLSLHYFSSAGDKEIARLSEELERKSAQVLELAEAEREDDRIIESLTARVGQLKSTLLHHEISRVGGTLNVVLPAARSLGLSAVATAPSVSSILKDPRIYSQSDFRLLATQFTRVAVRYERQFTVILVRLNISERESVVGAEKAAAEYRTAIEVIGKTLRTSDFAALEGPDSIIIGYPETSAIHVDAIMSRLRAAVSSSEARDLRIEIDRQDEGGLDGQS